jgi:hypothetical protein
MAAEPTEQDYADADALAAAVTARTGLKGEDLVCPRERSEMTPCVARDGRLAVCGGALCVGCEHAVAGLLAEERARA